MAQDSRRWRAGSVFGDGIRLRLDDGARRQWRARVELFARAGRITQAGRHVARTLIGMLGEDGALFPSHATIAARAGVSERHVRRVLATLTSLGLLRWQRRLVRTGWRVEQTSNAYTLHLAEAPAWPREAVRKSLKTSSARMSAGGQDAANIARQLAALGCHAAAAAALGRHVRVV